MAVRVNFTLPQDLVEALKLQVGERGRSAFVAEAVRLRLAQLERTQLEAELDEGYRLTREEGRQMNADWSPTMADGLSNDD